ncbi:MAG: hypothetical protein KDA89_02495 [Planctomycetaceae bacterium]|nr:hypothetical protein [Planctomycetaceae bacterium]
MSENSVSSDLQDEYEPDPLYQSGLREGRTILLMWATCFVWTLTVCLTFGYPESVNPETFPMVLGLPAWVFWGVLFPWTISNVVTVWFCLFRMEDGDLGTEPDEEEASSATPTAPPTAAKGGSR